MSNVRSRGGLVVATTKMTMMEQRNSTEALLPTERVNGQHPRLAKVRQNRKDERQIDVLAFNL
jgi:hypothetical protein